MHNVAVSANNRRYVTDISDPDKTDKLRPRISLLPGRFW